jgi:hypothetical protein
MRARDWAVAHMLVIAAFANLGIVDRVRAAEPPSETPRQIIDALAQRLYAIGETTVSLAEALEAEKTASNKIRAYAAGLSHDGLVEPDAGGQTPLIAAAFNGFPEVVTALLESQAVRQQIDARDSRGASAWIYANMALRESLSACNPSTLKNVFAWEPLMVTQYFYAHAPENPYRAVRRALESKGAKGTPAEAKKFWVDQCKNEDVGTKEKIEGSGDVLDTAVAVGIDTLSRFLIELQQKAPGVAAPNQRTDPAGAPR